MTASFDGQHRQQSHRVRFDWGPTGASAIAEGADVAVVVDVLSFTTTLCVAVERGMTVLPSPNGSSISFGLADSGCTVVGACLRNRSAVATWLNARGGTVAVVAAGERWPDGSLRPAAEDLWGAGAVLALLPRDDLSPEARLAADAFLAVEASLTGSVHGCASGLELSAVDFGDDVDVAAELDVSDVVPVLAGAEFTRA
jgi:2-phosphosulfolactate phosphatase